MVKSADDYQPSREQQSDREDSQNMRAGHPDPDGETQRVLEVIAELDKAVGELRKSAIRG